MSIELKPEKFDELLRDQDKARQVLEAYAYSKIPEFDLNSWFLGLLFCIRYFLKKFFTLKRRIATPTPTVVLMELGIVGKGDELNLFVKRQKICLDEVEHLAWLRMLSQLNVIARKFPSVATKIIAILNSLNQAMVGNCLKVYSIDVLINYMSNIYTLVRTLIEKSRIGKYKDR